MNENDYGQMMTVQSLHDYLENALEAGYGDMKIKLADGYLHEDELSGDYHNREVQLRGCLWHSDPYKRMCKFKQQVDEAFEKFILGERYSDVVDEEAGGVDE